MGIKAKKCLYEGVIIPTGLYGAEAWGMRSAERRKVNVLYMKCLRSLVGVSRMDRVRNEEVGRRAGIERELVSKAEQRVLRWFGPGPLQQRNDGIGCVTMRERTERVESPGTYVTE